MRILVVAMLGFARFSKHGVGHSADNLCFQKTISWVKAVNLRFMLRKKDVIAQVLNVLQNSAPEFGPESPFTDWDVMIWFASTNGWLDAEPMKIMDVPELDT